MAADLTHHSTGLSPAHIELVKMLAAIAVKDYLREVEAGVECTNDAIQQHEEITR